MSVVSQYTYAFQCWAQLHTNRESAIGKYLCMWTVSSVHLWTGFGGWNWSQAVSLYNVKAIEWLSNENSAHVDQTAERRCDNGVYARKFYVYSRHTSLSSQQGRVRKWWDNNTSLCGYNHHIIASVGGKSSTDKRGNRPGWNNEKIKEHHIVRMAWRKTQLS